MPNLVIYCAPDFSVGKADLLGSAALGLSAQTLLSVCNLSWSIDANEFPSL
jgi:hypothetical protein